MAELDDGILQLMSEITDLDKADEVLSVEIAHGGVDMPKSKVLDLAKRVIREQKIRKYEECKKRFLVLKGDSNESKD